MYLTECPRDAMQGRTDFIPTQQKIDYINALMAVKFDVLDCGSFVSAKAIPQMADTAVVMENIDKSISDTMISVIVAGISGAERAVRHEAVDILGFPFSISETFQQRNTHKSREEAYSEIVEIQKIAVDSGKILNLYFSMAFGNPYGESWDPEDLNVWAERFLEIGIKKILLSDTTGVADEIRIADVFGSTMKKFPGITFGAHFHNRYEDSYKKLKAAYDSGCRSFDSAIKGIGGCPMAKDELVGNMPTEQVFNFMSSEKIAIRQNLLDFEAAWNKAKDIFKF